jgi:uncharacterized membrane protein YdjX (TVP38/TMEM64 family)
MGKSVKMNIENTVNLTAPRFRDFLKSLIFIAVAVGVAYYITVKVGIDDLRAAIHSAGIYSPLIVILLKATTIVVVPLGGAPIYAAAGAIWGFWPGLGLTIIGDILGSTVAFYLSRFFGRTIVNFMVPKEYLPVIDKLVTKLSRPKSYLQARIFFSGFMELFAYASGLTRVAYPVFIFIHIGVHVFTAALLVVFGDFLVSGSKLVLILTGLIASSLAAAGVWWFRSDLTKNY